MGALGRPGNGRATRGSSDAEGRADAARRCKVNAHRPIGTLRSCSRWGGKRSCAAPEALCCAPLAAAGERQGCERAATLLAPPCRRESTALPHVCPNESTIPHGQTTRTAAAALVLPPDALAETTNGRPDDWPRHRASQRRRRRCRAADGAGREHKGRRKNKGKAKGNVVTSRATASTKERQKET